MIEKKIANAILKKREQNKKFNIYSTKFYDDLFLLNSSLFKDNQYDNTEYFKICTESSQVRSLIDNDLIFDMIENALHYMAMYGRGYLYIGLKYEQFKNQLNGAKELDEISFSSLNGILIRNHFFNQDSLNEVGELDISEGYLVIFDLKELGYKRNYFSHIINQLVKHDITLIVSNSLSKELSYDYIYHRAKVRELFLKQSKKTGWIFKPDDLSDSQILFNIIRMRKLKKKCLDYAIDKVNKTLVDSLSHEDLFQLKANYKDIDYDEIWARYQKGEIVESELSNILFK